MATHSAFANFLPQYILLASLAMLIQANSYHALCSTDITTKVLLIPCAVAAGLVTYFECLKGVQRLLCLCIREFLHCFDNNPSSSSTVEQFF